MTNQELMERVLEIAVEMARKGPGWAQQSTVLTEVKRRLNVNARDNVAQQRILTCWHDLFRLGYLSWGYDFDNPDAPFFHVPEPDRARLQAR